MRTPLLLSAALLAAAALAGCGERAQNETAEAAESVEGDSNVMAEAVNDLEAAEDAAFGAAENSYANASVTAENGAEAAQNAAEAATDEIEE